jgi:superfamily II DNA/RNA helicase
MQDFKKYTGYLENLAITAFNPMQEEFIRRSGIAKNLMLIAPTGSGKTLAFLIAVLNKIDPQIKGVQAIVVTPSRELALQIEQVFKTMKTSVKVSCFYGGHSMKVEQNTLSDAPAVLIATPGRLADHLLRKNFRTDAVKVVVLDEFDKSLQMGFHEQLRILFTTLSGKQQHILTSATEMRNLPDFLPFREVEKLDFLQTVPDGRLLLRLIRTSSADKVDALLRLISGFGQEPVLVFCNHRDAVVRISAHFKNHNFEHSILQGAMEQVDREKNLIKFRAGAASVLVATDLASRGLDIPEIKHVIHYQLPAGEEAFIHRNGRTARMHAHGVAYLILAEDESVPEYVKDDIEEISLPESIKKPQHPIYSLLYISAGKKGGISKGDIAGWLMKNAAIGKDDVGLITILDFSSYVAVKRTVAKDAISRVRDKKLKKVKVKVEVAN